MTEQFVVKQFKPDVAAGYYYDQNVGDFCVPSVFDATKYETYESGTLLLSTIQPDGNIYCIQKIYTNNIVPE